MVGTRRWLVMALVSACVTALTAFQQGPPGSRPGSPVALVGGTLIDGTGAAPIRNSVVLIRGERIERIGTTESVAIGPDYERISTEGMTVMPGMWDLHVHLMYGGHPNGRFWFDTYTPQFESVTIPASARQMLMAGVTSVRDLGAPPGIVAVKKRIASGELPGPTLYVAGPVLSKGAGAASPHVWNVARRRRRAGEDDPVDRVRRGLDQAHERRAVVARRAEGGSRRGAPARSEGGGPRLQRSRDPAGAGRRRRRLSAPADTDAGVPRRSHGVHPDASRHRPAACTGP